ncbi:MAG: HNH endonuclease [Pseudomonadota bacterium]
MIAEKTELILRELLEGTGAAFAASVRHTGLRQNLRIWFADLDARHGPVAELRPFGLRGHQVRLSFGNFSAELIHQMRTACSEDVQLARALVASIAPTVAIEIFGQDAENWCVTDGTFQLTATVRDLEQPHSDAAWVATCRKVIVPIMASMAELIGYDIVENFDSGNPEAFEGALLQSIVSRRERNPRNRLLCIRVHGEKCVVCGVQPGLRYGNAGSIIEVHHLQPLALQNTPRAYDPRTDLVPLCPSCHRAAHTRRPVPYSPAELRELMEPQDA